MARNDVDVDVTPADVFALFADGKRYAEWVVGAKYIRAVDPNWPAVGSKLHHTVGVGPIEVKDNTQVLEVQEPERLVLEARFRPVGRARIELTVKPKGAGSEVVMEETILRAPPWMAKLFDPTIFARNAEALRRLKEILEEGTTED